MSDEACAPFEEGDRVDHKIFGFGTVSGALTSMCGPDMTSPGGIRSAGWRVPVRWDDASRTAISVVHHVLRKVSSPDSRPFTFWERQWQPLLQTWLSARRDVEQALSSFRPAPDLAGIAALRHKEEEALMAMQRFLEDDASGKHA